MAKLIKKYFLVFIVIVSFLYSLPILFVNRRDVHFYDQVKRVYNNFFPMDLTILPEVILALLETFKMATLATFFATVISIVFAMLANRSSGSRFLRPVLYITLVSLRSIPGLIIAVIVVALIGASQFSGVVALTLYSIGYLGKFFIDALDYQDPRSADYLKVHRADRIQIFQYAQWPTLQGQLSSQFLWMWEYNIRSASIIGYVGAGGIGLLLNVYQEFGQWNRFSTVLFVFFQTILILEILAYFIKKSNRAVRN